MVFIKCATFFYYQLVGIDSSMRFSPVIAVYDNFYYHARFYIRLPATSISILGTRETAALRRVSISESDICSTVERAIAIFDVAIASGIQQTILISFAVVACSR
uniref:Uncharacterized protein n=1 Tax=Salmonella sp. TaxID=599 RepID=A0A482ETK0_SALSP|nr:hypothetical protein NNIBIDOC_00013 [Salmonella sp.]